MSHQIYTTPAVVLGVREASEATRTLTLYTRDHGLVNATAQGLRELKSKLRYNLQLFSWPEVSLVRGREVWRVVHVEAGELAAHREAVRLQLVARVAQLVLRLVAGEVAQPDFFEEFKSGAHFLERPFLTEAELVNFELIWVARLLRRLGYVEERPELAILFAFDDWLDAPLGLSVEEQQLSLDIINQALHHSHL